MRDVLQYAVNGGFSGIGGQMQHAGGFADGLAELKTIGDLFACSVNQ
jgi:hypothetical protein